MNQISLFVIYVHRILMEGLARLIHDDPSIHLVGTAKVERSVVKELEIIKPDIRLMEISMSNPSGFEIGPLIKQLILATNILILSIYDDKEFLRKTHNIGADGHLLTKLTADELIFAIKATYHGGGGVYLSSTVSRQLLAKHDGGYRENPNKTTKPVLTKREQEILQLIAEGLTNKGVANLLNISLRTIQTHRRNLMKKLDLHNFRDLLRYTVRSGLVKL
ncbi:response regulator transcription factor [Nitrospira defluvii]|nr:response regulator transcription factor [Nitrospira defluvii]